MNGRDPRFPGTPTPMTACQRPPRRGAPDGRTIDLPRERPATSSGAEGATAPETLRQKDRAKDDSLESGAAASLRRSHRRGNPARNQFGAPGKSLRSIDRWGALPASRRRDRNLVLGPRMTDSYRPAHARRRSTRCISSSAPRWCRSPATTCRCSTRPGILKEHLHTRARGRPVRCLAYGPEPSRRPDQHDDGEGARGADARRFSGPRRRPPALHHAADR